MQRRPCHTLVERGWVSVGGAFQGQGKAWQSQTAGLPRGPCRSPSPGSTARRLWGARFLPRDWFCCRRRPRSLPGRPLRPCARVSPCSPPQPAPGASPMKRSVSTLAPQRPRAAPLCNAAPDRAPAGPAAAHHHHRCHRRRDRKQKSLEKGPSLSADTDGGA